MRDLHKIIFRFYIFTLISLYTTFAHAATIIDVSHQSPGFLQGLIKPVNLTIARTSSGASHVGSQLQIINSAIDFNKTNHLRFKQTYQGVTVWGAEVMMHIPHSNGEFNTAKLRNSNISIPSNTVSNGFVYDKLEYDLPNFTVDDAARKKVAEKISQSYLKNEQINGNISNLQAETIIYVDPNTNKATWAYKITFSVKNTYGIVALPSMIVDAQSQAVYQQWDQLETGFEVVSAGGYGGNPNIGKLSYDGTIADYPSFKVNRVTSYNPFDKDFYGNCYIDNDSIKILNRAIFDERVFSFPCSKTDINHNNLYWNEDYMSASGGYSPPNDAINGVRVVSNFYKDWYEVPVLTNEDHKTTMQVIVKFDSGYIFPPLDDNASWNPVESYLFLGRGGDGFYPFTSIGIMAHELSHGFTTQHSNLTYNGGSGAMNEAFSDMAAQAVQYYLTGKNDWRIGGEVISDPVQAGCIDQKDCALRYMDNPPKDGKSLDNVVQAMNLNLNVHYTSGVFNKMFYLLSTQPEWNTKMAFNVMVQANQFYWISGDGTARNYKPIACGIIAAAKDYQSKDSHYDKQAVINVLKNVGFKDDGKPVGFPYYEYDLKDCE